MNIIFRVILVFVFVERIVCFKFIDLEARNRFRSKPSGNTYGNPPPGGSYGNTPGGSYGNTSPGGSYGNTPGGGSYGNIPPWKLPEDPYGPPHKPTKPHYGGPTYPGIEEEHEYESIDPHSLHMRNIPSVLKHLFKLNSYLASVTKKLQKGKESLKASQDDVPNLMIILDELKEKFKELGEPKLCKDGQFFSGKKCYQCYDPPTPFAEAQQKCLSYEGKLAIPDFRAASTFGTDILASDPARAGDKVWLNGKRQDDKFVMENGLILTKETADPNYRFKEGENLDTPDTGVFLYIPNVGETEWFVGVKLLTEPESYCCEFKPALNYAQPQP